MSSQADAAAPQLGRFWSALAVAGLLYTFICTFPGMYEPLAPNLDESWMFAINRLTGFGPYLFGRDTVFVYGPLGFLLTPREVGTGWSLIVSEVFWCLLQILLFAAVGWRLRGRAVTLLLFCGGYLALTALGLWIEYRFLFAASTFVMLSLGQSRRDRLLAVCAALLAVAALLMKWSMGLSALSVVAGSWLLLGREGTRGSRRVLWASVTAAVCSGLALVAIWFPSPANLWRWLFLSMQITRGYSAAMSVEGSRWPLLLACGSAACLVGLHFLLTAWPRRCLWLYAPFVFFAFKEGFVRQDGHQTAYFLAIAAVPVLLFLSPAGSGRDKRLLTDAFLFLSAVAALYAFRYEPFPAFRWRDAGSFITMRSGFANLQRLVFLSRTREELRAAAIRNLRPSVLPDSWQKRFDDARSTVSILPFEISLAAANRMNWQPTSVLQLYCAYTKTLDEATAAGLAERGAKYLVVTYEAIDGRNPILDTPLTWRAVTAHYEVLDADPNGRRVLLVRKKLQPEATQKVLEGRAAMNEWVAVRESPRLLYAALDISYTGIGTLADLFYHVPALFMETSRQNGRTERYRLVPRTAASAVLINYLPGDQYGMEELFRGKGIDPIVRFRLVPERSLRYFQNQYGWRLIESTRFLTPSGATPVPPAIPVMEPASSGRRPVSLGRQSR